MSFQDQSFAISHIPDLDTSISTNYQQQSLMDISISSISTKVGQIKDSLWNYFGIEKILERQDPRYQELIQYAENISQEAAVYYKSKKNKEQNKTKAAMDVKQCYQFVPSKYFDEGFQLSLSRKKAHESKLLLSQYLDQIDVTLFSIVNANFGKYMAPMLEIELMDSSTETMLKKINKGRDQLMKLQNQFIYKAIKTRKMAVISHNLSRLVTVLKYVKKIKDIPQKINKCIKEGRCDYDIFTQFQQTEQQQKICKELTCLSNTSKVLLNLRQQMTMYLKGLVDSTLYRYINGMLVYSKDKWSKSGIISNSQVDQSFNNDITILNITQIDFKQKQDLYEDPVLKSQLINLIKLCSKLQINIGSFGKKLYERIENFSQGFFEDLTQYLLQVLNIQNNQGIGIQRCFQVIDIEYYVKLVLIYFGILKNVFAKLAELYNYGNKSLGFNNILQPFREFIVEQTSTLMRLKNIQMNEDAQNFTLFLSLIDYWITAQEDEIPELELAELQKTKIELLQTYLKNFHQSTINGQLKQTIRTDTFQPAYIPADYYVLFQNLFNPQTIDQSLMLQNTFNSSIRKQRRKKQQQNTKKLQNNIIMLSKQLNINGQCYRVCISFLLLLQIIQEYGQMAKTLKNCQHLIERKTMDVINFYNNQTRKMLLGSQITKHGNITQVSLKNLNLLARVLCLIKLILSKLYFKDSQSKRIVQQNIMNHVNDICKEVSSVVVYNIDSEVTKLYETGQIKNVLGNTPPCQHSKKILQIMQKVKITLLQYWDINKTRALLKPGLKSISKLYFGALKNEKQRGQKQISWMLQKLQIHLGKEFEQQLKSI